MQAAAHLNAGCSILGHRCALTAALAAPRLGAAANLVAAAAVPFAALSSCSS